MAFPALILSGAVVSGQLGNASLVSGSYASGSVAASHISSGTIVAGTNVTLSHTAANITINVPATFTISFVGTSFVSEETISGIRAVNISQSGRARIAMASVSGRDLAVGIATANNLSGAFCGVFTAGSFNASSGLMDNSGYIGLKLFMGRSGHIVTASGSWNSGGLAGGDTVQQVGTAIGSGSYFIGLVT